MPSLEIEPAFGSGQPQFRIRGIGFQDYGSNNSSPVGVYLDEVSFAFPVQTQGLLFDLERVEVLRGPQGTLYGKNTTGGAINFVSKAPTKQTGVRRIHRHRLLRREDGAGLRLRRAQRHGARPALRRHRAGRRLATPSRTTGEKLGDKNISALRGQLEWDVTRDLTAKLSVNHNVDKSDVQGLYLFTARPSYGFAADASRRSTGWGFASDFAALVGASADAKPHKDNSATNVALTLNWDLGAHAG